MGRLLAYSVLLFVISGCAQSPRVTAINSTTNPARSFVPLPLFSANAPNGLPAGWSPLVILRTKKQTSYQLVSEENMTVLHARAESASSALMHEVNLDPSMQPWLHWRWKAAGLIPSADNSRRATSDSPVRIILGFDGDKDSLPFADQVLFETAKLVTGHDFPFATLMYVWENDTPEGTVIPSPHSNRIKLTVAQSGPDGLGQWRELSRNIVEDFENAFGEKPGRLIGIGVLTDTDNTGETVEAWYGDIHLSRERHPRTANDRANKTPVVLTQGK